MIYNANLSIAVQDPVSAMEAIIKMAENSGGFVVYSNVYQSSTDRGQFPTASLTVRVPAGQLDSIMAAIKDLTPKPEDDVLSENVSGQDVTAEFTDLESRLRNLEAAEAQLVDLMEMAQDADDVLAIFDELTYYRGEIEVVKGRMKYLSESVESFCHLSRDCCQRILAADRDRWMGTPGNSSSSCGSINQRCQVCG